MNAADENLRSLSVEAYKTCLGFRKGQRSFLDINRRSTPADHYAHWCLNQGGWGRMVESALGEQELDEMERAADWYGSYPPEPYASCFEQVEKQNFGVSIVRNQDKFRSLVNIEKRSSQRRLLLVLWGVATISTIAYILYQALSN